MTFRSSATNGCCVSFCQGSCAHHVRAEKAMIIALTSQPPDLVQPCFIKVGRLKSAMGAVSPTSRPFYHICAAHIRAHARIRAHDGCFVFLFIQKEVRRVRRLAKSHWYCFFAVRPIFQPFTREGRLDG